MSFDLIGVFGAGVLTLVTPCVAPLIPIYLALLFGGAPGEAAELKAAGGRAGAPASARLRLFGSTLLFSLGLASVFVALGLSATWAGGLLAAYRPQLAVVGGIVIFLLGLKLLGVLRLGWLDREKRLDGERLQTRWRPVNALIMGAVFALGWTPCVGPVLGSVLTYAASAASSPGRGALLLGTYAAGIVVPLLVLALFADSARRWVRQIGPWLARLQRLAGALLVAVGLLMVFTPSQGSWGTLPAAGPVSASRVEVTAPLGAATARPRLVEFYAPDCGACSRMAPIIASIERECGGRQVEVMRVDVTSPTNQRIANDYRITGVPTFVVLDRTGEPVERMIGAQPASRLREAVARVSGDSC